ncbi:MHYT domain-containing protein [Streptomyces sp. NPDC005202]|uniref:MHYT domain-containing protein n=1 Tax=Streptomyces sp. NPDC005202 TaxID=3157021 RepID=UPI0033B013A3
MTHNQHLFSHAFVPLLAYSTACIGSALGLGCAGRYRARGLPDGLGWLVGGALTLGSGIWGMHFIAMLGFTVDGVTVRYGVALTIVSWVLAVLTVGVGMLIAGRDGTTLSLVCGGLVSGLGVAAMHHLGMAALRVPGSISYSRDLVALSIVIAIVATTAALWATLQVKGVMATTCAVLVMGLAISGMHYTGMLAARVSISPGVPSPAGPTAVSFITPLVAGLSVLILYFGVALLIVPVADQKGRDRARNHSRGESRDNGLLSP